MFNSSSEVMALICKEVNSIKKHESVEYDPSTLASLTIEELDLTSLDMLELIMSLEESLDIDITLEFSENTAMIDVANTIATLSQLKTCRDVP